MYPQNYIIPVFFLIHQKQKQPFKAVILLGTLQSQFLATLISLYFIRHGVSKTQNQRFHAPARDIEEHVTVICPVTPTHSSCIVCLVMGQIDPAI